MNKHLAIFNNHLADKVLSGEKTVDFRFSQVKIAPYLKIMKGDIVLIKNVGQAVSGQVEVDNVLYYDDLFPVKIKQIKNDYLKRSAITNQDFDKLRQGAKYLSIIFLKNPHRYIAPPKVHKSDRRGWAVL